MREPNRLSPHYEVGFSVLVVCVQKLSGWYGIYDFGCSYKKKYLVARLPFMCVTLFFFLRIKVPRRSTLPVAYILARCAETAKLTDLLVAIRKYSVRRASLSIFEQFCEL